MLEYDAVAAAAGHDAVQDLAVVTPEQIEARFAHLDADALIVLGDSLTGQHRELIIGLAAEHGVPAMYWAPDILVRGSFAQVWTPYVLRDNGAVVHCGVNAFQMVKLEGGWKIHSALSSMEPQACDELGAATATGLRPRDGWRETRNE